jgi:hypothetical protein
VAPCAHSTHVDPLRSPGSACCTRSLAPLPLLRADGPAWLALCTPHAPGSPINDAIARAGLMPHLRRLLSHPDAGVRARVCNLIGNMCRHSGEGAASGSPAWPVQR